MPTCRGGRHTSTCLDLKLGPLSCVHVVLHKPYANSYSTCAYTSYNTECKRTEEHRGGADTFTVKGAKDNNKWYKDL